MAAAVACCHIPALNNARAASKGNLLVKPNYQFEKRQRDLAKKQKQEEKRRQKLAEKADVEGAEASSDAVVGSAEEGGVVQI